jgi:hypothetical protein
MLTTAAINLGLLTALFFILGMIRPGWPLFFMDKPNRFIILMVTTVLIMVSFTMFGEGIKRGQKPNEWTKIPMAGEAKPATSPAVTAPVPVPEIKNDIPAPVPQTAKTPSAPSAPVAPPESTPASPAVKVAPTSSAPAPTTALPAANTTPPAPAISVPPTVNTPPAPAVAETPAKK